MDLGYDSLVGKADDLAFHAHQVIMDHRRKYDNTPYIDHPRAVAKMVYEFGGSQTMIAAALLHDTLEDTPLDPQEIFDLDGTGDVLRLVQELTDVSKPTDGPRIARKFIDRAHTSRAGKDAQNIKMCDLIHNAQNIQDFDPKFAKVYRNEMRLLLPLMYRADESLKATLTRILEEHPDG